MTPERLTDAVTLYAGDCLAVLPSIATASVDAVVCDPPYPCIKRDYGTWTEAEWFALMTPVVEECRRVLKPSGSAVFIIQPNSERVGRMRTWWLRFMLQWADEWGMVQDAWWWNTSSLPHPVKGQLTPAIKPCVWVGGPDCYRDPLAVVRLTSTPPQDAPAFSHARGEHSRKRMYAARDRNGGSWPHNCIPVGGRAGGPKQAGDYGHGAGTPLTLARWWVRYICPPGGTVLDPFGGSGTTALAAVAEGRRAVLIERHAPYCDIIRRRVAPVESAADLFTTPCEV